MPETRGDASMITFMDLGPKATVHLLVQVPVAMASGGWAWGELPAYAGVLAREFAYSARECTALVHTYGRMVGQLLQSGMRPDRFLITARGPVTGKVVGMREWHWEATQHQFIVGGEYLCGWRSAVRSYFELTGELFEGVQFSARPSGLPVVTGHLPVARAA